MDKARRYTDRELANIERNLATIYREASEDVSRKWNEYMAETKPQVEALEKAVKEAKAGGDAKEIRDAQKAYSDALKEYTIQNKYYKEMVDQTAEQLTHANEKALAYVNGEMPKIYTANYNQMAIDTQDIAGYRFDMVNERAVRGILKDLDIEKDMRWNAKNINSQVLQGIIQGESIDAIAGRLENVVGMNSKAAVRNARTMTTGAENRGRQDSYKQATEDGIILKRVWVATNDERTREWHAELDGVEVDVDEPWENDYGEIMFPGDPAADGANIYNCRCAMRVDIKGFDWPNHEGKEPEEELIASISEKTLTKIDGYIEGTGNTFTKSEVEEIKENMTKTKESLFRVEDISWMGEDLETGQVFEFDKPLKGFTQEWDTIPTILSEGDDAGLYESDTIAIFQTVDDTYQLDISKLSRNHEEEKESLVGGKFEVIDEGEGPVIAGHQTWLIYIKQIEK